MKRFRCFIIYIWTMTLFIMHCAHLKEARTSYDENDFATAARLCKQAIAADSTDAQAYLLLAECYHGMDSLNTALSTVKQASRLKPASSAITREQCRILKALGKRSLSEKSVTLAVSHLRSAEKLCPNDKDVLVLTADAYYEIGRIDDAKDRYEKARNLLSDTAHIHQRLISIGKRTQEAQAFYQNGLRAIEKNQLKTAKKQLEKAVAQKADFKNAQYHLHMTNGKLLYKKGSKGDLWDAVEVFGLASTLKDSLAEPHFWLAQAYEKKDRDEFTNAIDEYETALRLDPDGPLADTCKKKLKELKKRKEKLDKFWGRKE